MTRNIDILVEAHRQADGRRRRGLHPWAYCIPVADALERARAKPATPEHIGAVTAEIAAMLRRHLPAAWTKYRDASYDRDFDELLDRLEGTNASYLTGTAEDEILAIFDDILTELYDWADLHRVNCGLPRIPTTPGPT